MINISGCKATWSVHASLSCGASAAVTGITDEGHCLTVRLYYRWRCSAFLQLSRREELFFF